MIKYKGQYKIITRQKTPDQPVPSVNQMFGENLIDQKTLVTFYILKEIINDFGRSLQKPYEDQVSTNRNFISQSIQSLDSSVQKSWFGSQIKDISDLMGKVINATTPNCIEEIHHKCADEREVYINNIITHLYDLPLSERLVAYYYFFLFGIGICANVLVMR